MKIRVSPSIAKVATVAFATAWMLCCATSPTNSLGSITFNGSTAAVVGLFAGTPGTLASAPGVGGSGVVAASDSPGNPAPAFNTTFNLGTLDTGDGTNSVATLPLRVRGNVPCHISASVISSTPTANLRYAGVNQTPLLLAQRFRLGTSGAPVAGGTGNAVGAVYGPRFTSGIDTLRTLNGGVFGAVATGSDKVASFPNAPSLSGNLTTATNYVQVSPTFSVPTGAAWSATGGGGASFSLVLGVEAYSQP